MSDVITSLIRTGVPVGVGAVLSWLLTLGVEVDPDTQAGLITALTAVMIAVYYTLARVLESRWPWLGVLLGAPRVLTYERHEGGSITHDGDRLDLPDPRDRE